MSVAELSDISDGHRLVFAVQIGLEREAVTVALDGYAEFTMATLTDIACAFVDRKVSDLILVLHFRVSLFATCPLDEFLKCDKI
jgi:hypothetical protein